MPARKVWSPLAVLLTLAGGESDNGLGQAIRLAAQDATILVGGGFDVGRNGDRLMTTTLPRPSERVRGTLPRPPCCTIGVFASLA